MAYAAEDDAFYEGYPLIATLIASGVALAGLAVPIQWDLAEQALGIRVAVVAGEAMLATAILWGIAWWATIRKSSPAWKAGSFITILLVSLFVALVHFSAPHAAITRQKAEAQAMVASAMGEDMTKELNLPPDAGPLARVQATIINGIIRDFNAFDAESERAGVQEMGITLHSKSAPVLKRCGAISALADRARDVYAKRLTAHLAASERIGKEGVAQGRLPRGAIDAFLQGFYKARAQIGRRWEIRALMSELTGEACVLLRDRPWIRENGVMLFYSDSDLARYRAILDQIDTLVREEQMILEQARGGAEPMLVQPPG